jgi:hypothetical protein
MLWNLLSRKASIEARTSTKPWTEWLYRAMGTDTREADADLCGAVEAAARAGRVSDAEAHSVRTLCERYFGPGEIEAEYVQAALQLFAGKPDEQTAIELFQLYDRVTSQERPVHPDELKLGAAKAEGAGASGLAAFLLLQLASRALADGDLEGARRIGEDILNRFAALAKGGTLYESRMNLSAAFLYSVADRAGDPGFKASILASYRSNIEAYLKSQE